MTAKDHQKQIDEHDRAVNVVADAVARLLVRFGPHGLTPEAIFEGSVRGSAVALIAARSISADQVAELLEEMAAGFRALEKPNLKVVQ